LPERWPQPDPRGVGTFLPSRTGLSSDLPVAVGSSMKENIDSSPEEEADSIPSEAPALNPPADIPEILRGNWLPLPNEDPVVAFLLSEYQKHFDPPGSWEVARLSSAAYLYRETISGWTVAAKFYAPKKGDQAEEFARRELDLIERGRQSDPTSEKVRPILPYGVWRGVLFLEYVDGLTLEDIIAVRRSRPGTLVPNLNWTARFLARLHEGTADPKVKPDFDRRVMYFHKLIDNLVRYGVLKDNPVVAEGLASLVEGWADDPRMVDFIPVLIHGDATTTNFIFPWEGGVVAIDWERAKFADPASDLGRLMAEVAHSIKQHGGNAVEAQPFVFSLAQAYCQALSGKWDKNALLDRARFYQALSTARIARNGWVSRLDRMALVAQAMALLSGK